MRRAGAAPEALRALRLACSLEGGGSGRGELGALFAAGAGAPWWEPFAELLEVHGLAPWADARLRRAGLAELLPPPVAARLRDAWRIAALRNRVHAEQLGRVAGAFAGAGVAGIALKGAALLGRAYPEPGMRPMQDLDVLVRPGEIEAAASALAGLGYVARRPAAPGARREHFHEVFAHGPSGTVVELHWGLSDAGLVAPAAAAAVWEGAVAGPGGLLRLDPATELVFVAVHAAKHGVLNLAVARRPELAAALLDPLGGNRLLWLLDVHRLLGAGAARLEEASEVARAWNALAELHAGVVLAQRLFGDVPGQAWRGPVPRGMSAPRALLATALARGLVRGSPLAVRVLGRLMRVDPHLHARPVRALELFDRFAPQEEERERWRRRHGAATLPLLRLAALGRGVAATVRACGAALASGRARRRGRRARGGPEGH